MLVLTTHGRRTGRPRSTPVAYFRDGERLVISAANAGLDQPPAWWLNLQADPHAEVEVDGRRSTVLARRADGDEAERLFARFVAQNAGAETTRAFTARQIPVIVLEPTDHPARG